MYDMNFENLKKFIIVYLEKTNKSLFQLFNKQLFSLKHGRNSCNKLFDDIIYRGIM